MDSILEESKKARTYGVLGFFKRRSVIAVIVLLFISGTTWYVIGGEANEPASGQEQRLKSSTVKKDDIKVAIESDGKVVARDGVELSFSVSGDTLELTEVFVEEGQTVSKGDKIATVDAESLELSVRSAYASYQSALASYNDKLDGASEEDKTKAQNNITQAEISLEQSTLSLERIKANADISIKTAKERIDDAKEDLDYDFESEYEEEIDEKYKDLVNTIKSIAIDLDDILKGSDEILGVDDRYINDDFEDYLGVKNSSSVSDAEYSYLEAKEVFEDLNEKIISMNSSSANSIIYQASLDLQECLRLFEEHLYDMQIMLSSSITSASLSQSQLDMFKSNISSNRSSINNKISSLQNSQEAVDDALTSLEDYREDYDDNLQDRQDEYEDAEEDLVELEAGIARDIADAESNIKNKELSLSEAKLDYEELLAPLTASELSSAKSSLTSASVSLERANNELEEATLTSPIDGEIAVLNYKTGDTILKDDSKPVVSIINNDTLFIEVDIEEADISMLQVAQRAVASFDALDEAELEGEISFISLTSETSNNGIVTYLVRVVFENKEQLNIREGMSAYVEFITGGVSDVIAIPVEAVRNVGGSPSVQLESGEWVEVVTGFTDGDDVEIVSGLSMGDRIVY